MFPYLFPLASPSLPPSLSHPSRWSHLFILSQPQGHMGWGSGLLQKASPLVFETHQQAFPLLHGSFHLFVWREGNNTKNRPLTTDFPCP